MEGKKLKGIALILFGIRLYMSGSEINSFFRYKLYFVPFSMIGVMIGIVGLVIVFNEKDK